MVPHLRNKIVTGNIWNRDLSKHIYFIHRFLSAGSKTKKEKKKLGKNYKVLVIKEEVKTSETQQGKQKPPQIALGSSEVLKAN